MAAGTKVAKEAINVVADAAEFVAEESTELAETTRGLSPRDVGLLFGGVGIGVSLGFAGGYYFLQKKLTLKYQEIADTEIAAMREHYNAKLRAVDANKEKKTLDEVSKDLGYAIQGEEGGGRVPYHQVGSDPDKVQDNRPPVGNVTNVTNVFNTPQPEVVEEEWDLTAEMENRSADVPYVIHRDEYDAAEKDFEQHTLTYFEGDDVLSNERDQVIEDQDSIIGLGNLARFGVGSGDPNIVYVRNEEMKVDIEIVHSDGKYATEVHGFQDDELKHSSMRRRSPRRSEHDSSD